MAEQDNRERGYSLPLCGPHTTGVRTYLSSSHWLFFEGPAVLASPLPHGPHAWPGSAGAACPATQVGGSSTAGDTGEQQTTCEQGGTEH